MNKVSATTQLVVKRLLVGLFDAVAVLTMAILALPAFTEPAWAYVDPSVMTYTIQALAGVAVALSAVAGVAFRRTRKALFKVLKIDENAKKTSDPQWKRMESDSSNLVNGFEDDEAIQAVISGDANNRLSGNDTSGLSWSKRLGFAFMVSLFICFTVLITAPFEIMAGASGDLSFGLRDVWWIMALFALGCTCICTLLLSAVPKKAFTVVLVIAFSFGLACYIQAAFLNTGLPQADGRSVDWWGAHSQMMIFSAVVWLVVLVAPAVASKLNFKISRIAVCVLSLMLVIVQGAGVISLFLGNGDEGQEDKGPIAVTEDGLFEVSGKNNVIVFVLDCYDTKVFEKVVADDPDMLNGIDGFTWYKNSSGEMIPTSLAIPYLLSAETPSVDETATDYLKRRYIDGSFLEDLDSLNYSIGIYTDSFGTSWIGSDAAREHVYDHVTNAHALTGGIRISKSQTVIMLTKCALYRDMPWLLKPRFWFYTDEMNQRIAERTEGVKPEEMIYYLDDASYHAQLNRFGLTVDDSDFDGAFKLIHLNGAHYPYNIDENGNDVGLDNSDQERQARGSMRIVGEYLGKLKALGLYDDATIIITSDHGDWSASMDMPSESTEPILLVKPAGVESNGDGLEVSNAPVSHADFHASVLEAMGADSGLYGKYGYTYDDIDEGMERTRTFYHIFHDLKEAKIRGWLKYEINGDVLDFSNWSFTGDMWEANYTNVLD